MGYERGGPGGGSPSATSGSGLNLAPTAVKTANYSAAAGDLVLCDTSGGAFTVTLPTAPADKTTVAVKLVTAGNTLNLALGGSDVFNKAGGATTGSLSLLNQAIVLQYQASTAVWIVVSDDLTLTALDARYATPAVGKLPNALTGTPALAVWFKADAIVGKVDGDAISQWDDSSGNARHIVQATGTKQPIYKATVRAFALKPALRFDGVDDFLSNAASGIAAGTAWTAFVVCHTGQSTSTMYVFDGRGSGFMDLGYDSSEAMFQAGAPTRSTGKENTRGTVILTGVGEATGVTVYRDGQVRGRTETTISSSTPSQLYLGSNAGVGAFWNGDIAEFGLYAATLTPAQVKELHQGLAYKYGLVVSA